MHEQTGNTQNKIWPKLYSFAILTINSILSAKKTSSLKDLNVIKKKNYLEEDIWIPYILNLRTMNTPLHFSFWNL